MMPIPLTPPDDEVGICIPYSVIIYMGYIYYNINIMAHLPFSCVRLCQPYDYVYLIFKAMSSMTLLSLYLDIHFQFILFYIIFHQPGEQKPYFHS